MAKTAQILELQWLRSFVELPCREIDLSLNAQQMMIAADVPVADLMHILRDGLAVSVERTTEATTLTIHGRNCDDDYFEVKCWINTEEPSVGITSVMRI